MCTEVIKNWSRLARVSLKRMPERLQAPTVPSSVNSCSKDRCLIISEARSRQPPFSHCYRADAGTTAARHATLLGDRCSRR